MTLDELGLKHGTDKNSNTHGYLNTYEKYFSEWKDKEFTLLELGVASGSSIRLWRDYFTKAKVYGIDNNPQCAAEGIFIGSQTDTDFLDKVLSEIGEPLICIDDASHYSPNTIETFRHLFPKIKEGGQYYVEDTHCFYDQTYGLAPTYGEGMSEVFKFFTGLACDVDVHGKAMTGNTEYAINYPNEVPPVPKYSRILDSIHIHPSLWIFKRK